MLCAASIGGCDGGANSVKTADASVNASESNSVDAGKREVMAAVRPRDVPPEVATAANDWPLPNRDYDNTRAVLHGLINRASIAELQEAWRVPFERGGPFGYVTSNPLIVGDRVFIQDMQSQVYAIDRETGEVRFKVGKAATSVGPNGVAIGWDRLYANLGDVGVVAFDATDGKELWRFEPELKNSEGLDVQPIAYADRVFVSTVPASLRGAYLGGSRGVIHALDASDGSVRWSFDTVDSEDFWGDPMTNGGGGAWYPPLINADRQLIYWGTGNPSPLAGTPDKPSGSSRPGPNLYTSCVVALDLDSGALEWFHQEKPHDLFDWDFQNAPMRVPADAESGRPELVIGSGKTGTVVALDPATGGLVWRARVGRHENDDLDELPVDSSIRVYPGALGGVLTATAYADGVVYVPVVNVGTDFTGSGFDLILDISGATGALTALDVRDGSVLWNAELDAPSYGAATVVNDLVLTSDGNGRVYAFSRDDGMEVWHYDAPGGINAPLAVADDMLLIPVGVDQGMLIALRLPRTP